MRNKPSPRIIGMFVIGGVALFAAALVALGGGFFSRELPPAVVFFDGSVNGLYVGAPVNFRGVRLGIPICEDIWGDLGVCETLAESGAEILLSPNGSPYYRGKVDVRHQIVLKQVIETDPMA